MKTIFLSLALFGMSLAQEQGSQFNGQINSNLNMEAFSKSFQNLNAAQPFGRGEVQLSQDF